MDIISTATATATAASVKTPEAETETPTRIQPTKPLPLTNGVLKRHTPHLSSPPVVTYKECLKNHAASLGGHAVDGCGEFMPSPTATPTDPTSLKCAACGCHRNFHRREPEEPFPLTTTTAQHVIEYQPHHRHHPPPPLPHHGHSSPNSPSPPPISSSFYPSAPHMLLALSAGLSGHPQENNPSPAGPAAATTPNPNGRKRFRTKFTQDQKDRMYEFAESVAWKMQKKDEERDANNNDNGTGIGIGSKNSMDNTTTHYHHHNHNNDDDDNGGQNLSHLHHNNDRVSPHVIATNGSSSSS
ncbi:hypothetical protein F0562_005073 [Nyssa sinensis]|uniref:ZF-HD dimerization-type domain-containing protein n=1 Tax=Nyssa sinensis TaxID=561372 RepID=A0A5J5AJC2_9ASTE|nr:hypothetical protein F0562_005073 [Nyssa sinensis]